MTKKSLLRMRAHAQTTWQRKCRSAKWLLPNRITIVFCAFNIIMPPKFCTKHPYGVKISSKKARAQKAAAKRWELLKNRSANARLANDRCLISDNSDIDTDRNCVSTRNESISNRLVASENKITMMKITKNRKSDDLNENTANQQPIHDDVSDRSSVPSSTSNTNNISTASTSAVPTTRSSTSGSDIANSDNKNTSARDWAIIELNTLNLIFTDIYCPKCDAYECLEISKTSDKSLGFSHSMNLVCKHCDYNSKDVFSSPRVKDSNKMSARFEINDLMVLLVNELGLGYAALQKVSKIIGIGNIHLKSYQRINASHTEAKCHVADDVLQNAAEAVRHCYRDLDPNQNTGDPVEIMVSFDGTWHKRGYTSHHGVGFVIETLTGLVLDYEVLSSYCHACSLARARDESPEWFENHKSKCEKNFDGSSKAMEQEAAMRMFSRSVVKHNLIYKSILCDGDSSSHSALVQNKVYGPQIQIEKLDCINHADKRMGTALINLSKNERLGGRGDGRLTKQKAITLQKYYGRALRNNIGEDVETIRCAIWASLLHCMSTDESPHHNRCPPGEESWCFYQRAQAAGQHPPPHADNINTPLSGAVAEKMVPVYRRMSDPALLNRLRHGKTQNPNESLNNLVWVHCPKTVFVGHSRVKSAVATAVTKFNLGASQLMEVIRSLEIEPTQISMASCEAEDSIRIKKAKRASDNAVKIVRKKRAMARKQNIAALEDCEGVTYGAGNF